MLRAQFAAITVQLTCPVSMPAWCSAFPASRIVEYGPGSHAQAKIESRDSDERLPWQKEGRTLTDVCHANDSRSTVVNFRAPLRALTFSQWRRSDRDFTLSEVIHLEAFRISLSTDYRTLAYIAYEDRKHNPAMALQNGRCRSTHATCQGIASVDSIIRTLLSFH